MSMQNRLKHLESLVKDVMTGQSPGGHSDAPPPGNASDPIAFDPQHGSPARAASSFAKAFDPTYKSVGLSNPSGQVVLGPNESTYVGATHWAAILDDVSFYKVQIDFSIDCC